MLTTQEPFDRLYVLPSATSLLRQTVPGHVRYFARLLIIVRATRMVNALGTPHHTFSPSFDQHVAFLPKDDDE
jgi:hypothetical protein